MAYTSLMNYSSSGVQLDAMPLYYDQAIPTMPHLFRPYASYQPRISHKDPTICTYPSKVCHHQRAIKRDGSLHRFCEFHRRRANQNQQRWSKRKQRATGKKLKAGVDPAVLWMLGPEEMTRSDDSLAVDFGILESISLESPFDLSTPIALRTTPNDVDCGWIDPELRAGLPHITETAQFDVHL